MNASNFDNTYNYNYNHEEGQQDRVYNHMNNNQNINVNNINENNDINPEEIDEEKENQEKEIMKVYQLVDLIPLSRQKKNITRDFADGVLLAELIKFFIPKYVELHNYITSNNMKTKRENWGTLNRKVLKKLGFGISNTEIESIINYAPGCIEFVLQKIFNKLYENGIDVEDVISRKTNNNNINNHTILNFGENVSGMVNNNNTNNKIINTNHKYHQLEEEYKQELVERDSIIDELKIALEETEKNLKISEENKKILSHQLEVLKNKVKEMGLY